jgi:type IV fimbrial biogenesis protein FimT
MNSSKLFQRGVTLIEAGITTSVVAIAATLGVPSFTQTRDARALEGVSTELGHDLQYVRSEAVARNQNLRLTVHSLPEGGACYVIHAGAASDCTCTSDGTAQCAGGIQPVKSVAVLQSRGVSLATNSRSMAWSPTIGTVSPAGTLRLSLADGRSIHHVVSIVGRSRACSPLGRVRALPAC